MIELPTDENPVVIIHGDCQEILPQIPAGVVDAVVTDPPYGIFKRSDDGIMFGKKTIYSKDKTAPQWDKRPSDQILVTLKNIANYYVIWGANYFADVLGSCKSPLVWNKMTGNNSYADGELAWSNVAGTMRIFTHQWCGAFKDSERGLQALHPTQKPVALMRWCIQHLPKSANVILDPFAGSGTTGVAAILEGRKAILIEKDAGYVEVIKKRIAEALGKPTTLANGRTVGRNLFESVGQEALCVRE